jgi:hypothetical protein
MPKMLSRTKRWFDAAQRAVDALQELVDIQSEFSDWRDNLPENLQSSALAKKLETVCDLDLSSALEAAQEAVDSRSFGVDTFVEEVMHTGPVPGKFDGDAKLVAWPCKKCGNEQTEERSWESSDGAYDDYKYTCPKCGHSWWEEGPDA